jgi:site-specific recombinase XerD
MTADELREMSAGIFATQKNKETLRMYRGQLNKFLKWYKAEQRAELSEATVGDYVDYLLESGTVATLNIGILVVKKLTAWLADRGAIDKGVAWFASTLNPLPQEQADPHVLDGDLAKALIAAPDLATVKGVRDRAIMAALLGCGLDRSECARLTVGHMGDGQLLGVMGKYGKARDIPMPPWVADTIAAWLDLSEIASGPLFVRTLRGGHIQKGHMTGQAIYDVVHQYAAELGEYIRPRSLRQTYLSLTAQEQASIQETMAKLRMEIASLRRALQIKANLTPDRLAGATIQHWDRRD